ncbi:MAG TPA: pepsin/retropepsin-like aspartic protease family protein [Mucilaginibacter sp.]|nr:pepsin/retropepsin-like aspartic protease family protein [Mucilaginibacter sp.]
MSRVYMLLLALFSVLYCENGFSLDKKGAGKIIHLKSLPADPDPYGDFNTLVVPIKRAGNLIIVEAQVDTVEGNFVLDTGAPYLVLNATYFRNAPHINEQEAGGVNGESSSETFTTAVKNLSILDLHYPRLTADVTDLSAIENQRHIKILGLLGTRLFSKMAITVDLLHNELYIHKLDEHGNIQPGEQQFDHPQLKTSFKYLNDIIFLKGAINGNRPMWFAFDSGSEVNLIDHNYSKKVLQSLRVVNRLTLTGVGGSTFEVINAEFGKLTIADQTFLNDHILITDLEKMGHFYGQSIDGVLGYDFFARGAFTINFVKEEFEMYIYNNQ